MTTTWQTKQLTATLHATFTWTKPSREAVAALLGMEMTCNERPRDWTECVAATKELPMGIGGCRFSEYRRSPDRVAALPLRFRADARPVVADFVTLEQALGEPLPDMDSPPLGKNIHLDEIPLFYRRYPRHGRARISLRHYRDGRVSAVHVEWAPSL